LNVDIDHIGDRPMTQTSNRPLAIVLSALVAVALWLPTVTVPADATQFAAAPAAVELA
jgi:hypothetical protein